MGVAVIIGGPIFGGRYAEEEADIFMAANNGDHDYAALLRGELTKRQRVDRTTELEAQPWHPQAQVYGVRAPRVGLGD